MTLNKDGNLETAPDTIWTYTDRTIRPLDPSPEDVCIEDIAHALSNQCRFTGHTRKFYSVAEHSVLCSYLVPDELQLTTLLHDASEAYLSDIARPLKHAPGFGVAYREAEHRLEKAIALRFDLIYPYPEIIRTVDNLMLSKEIQRLMPPGLTTQWPMPENADPAPEPLCLVPEAAERLFLRTYGDIVLGMLTARLGFV